MAILGESIISKSVSHLKSIISKSAAGCRTANPHSHKVPPRHYWTQHFSFIPLLLCKKENDVVLLDHIIINPILHNCDTISFVL